MNFFSSLHFSRSVVSDYLRPDELQHARPPCPSPTPGVHPNSCPLKWWCHPTISSSFFFFNFILFNFTILYWFCHISKWICHRYTCVPHPEPSSLLSPHTIPLGHPSAPAPSIQLSCIEPGLATHFIYDIIHISMPFSQIIPPSPSPTESIRLFYTF